MALDIDPGLVCAAVTERFGLDECQFERCTMERAWRLIAWTNCGNPHHRIDFVVPDNDLLVSRHGAAELLERVRIAAERIDCACNERIGTGRHSTTWGQADLWFPEASVYFDRDVAPEGWEARLSVEQLPRPMARSSPEPGIYPRGSYLEASGPPRWILWADDMACIDRTRRLGQRACRCVMWTGARWERRIDRRRANRGGGDMQPEWPSRGLTRPILDDFGDRGPW